MMAAGRAASLGTKGGLNEKKNKVGKKLDITGGGGCNIPNAELDIRKMVAQYGRKGKSLFGSFTRFGVAETFDFFESRGLKLKVEAEKRAFPQSNKAQDVWKVIVDYMKQGKVEIVYNAAMTGFNADRGRIIGISTKKGEITANNYVLATGGKSRPETGSKGEGFEFLKQIGDTVKESDSALVPVKTSEAWAHDLAGLSFHDVGLKIGRAHV